MNKTKSILNLPVFLSALWAVFRLTGLPISFHLSYSRVALIFLVLCGCCIWSVLFRDPDVILSKKGWRALFFQSCLLGILFSLAMLLIKDVLITREGILYVIGAFLTQAAPFFVFLAVLDLCIILLLLMHINETHALSVSAFFRESTLIPEVLFLLIACLLVYGAFLPLRDNYYPSHDYAIFSYIGKQILRGKMPYTELWDHKPPVIFYLNALGLKMANGSLAGIWLLEFAAFFTGSLLLLSVLKRFFPKWISLPVLFFGILHYVRVLDFGNYTEEISLFFSLCALAIYFSGKLSGHSRISGFLCGCLCGLAFTCKQNTIGGWIALFILDILPIISFGNKAKQMKKRAAFWLFAGIAFFLINLGWVVYFASNHALEAYWDVAFLFNFIYSEHSTDSRLACAFTTLTFLPSVSFFLAAGFLSWVPEVFRLFKDGLLTFVRKHPLTAWTVIDLPIELFFAGLSGMNYQHYFILCIPPVIILLCSMIFHLTSKLSISGKRFQTGILLLLGLLSLPLAPSFRDNYERRTPSSYTKVRDYLLENTTENESILVWGSRTAIYVMSERYAPTAYFNERPLYLFPGEIQKSQWEELHADLKKDPPQVIIYTHDTALPFVSVNEGVCQSPYFSDYTQPVFQFFCDNYKYETTINPEFHDAWDVYSRKQ